MNNKDVSCGHVVYGYCKSCTQLPDRDDVPRIKTALFDKDTTYGVLAGAFDSVDGRVVKMRFSAPAAMPDSAYRELLAGAHGFVHTAIAENLHGWRSCACDGTPSILYCAKSQCSIIDRCGHAETYLPSFWPPFSLYA